ncbi:MAG TPA: hypothetical protein VGI21_04190 [Streptosporangiaceae bacterium]|jgi:hypothetical protein
MSSEPRADDHGQHGPGSGDARAMLRAWILAKNDDLDAGALSDQTPLLTTRYLRSVHLPELILLLERVRGTPIDVEYLGAGDFRDIDTIVTGFITPAQNTEPAS